MVRNGYRTPRGAYARVVCDLDYKKKGGGEWYMQDGKSPIVCVHPAAKNTVKVVPARTVNSSGKAQSTKGGAGTDVGKVLRFLDGKARAARLAVTSPEDAERCVKEFAAAWEESIVASRNGPVSPAGGQLVSEHKSSECKVSEATEAQRGGDESKVPFGGVKYVDVAELKSKIADRCSSHAQTCSRPVTTRVTTSIYAAGHVEMLCKRDDKITSRGSGRKKTLQASQNQPQAKLRAIDVIVFMSSQPEHSSCLSKGFDIYISSGYDSLWDASKRGVPPLRE